MVFEIRSAERKRAKLRLGVSGTSGSGKTLGSLLLAYGITNDWKKIGLIDTEEGSGELYTGTHVHGVTIGEYRYGRISKPFTIFKYLEALHAMERAGIEVIIIDSATHAWSGSGGLLEKQGKLTDESKSKNSYYAWRQVTPEHNAFVEALLQSPQHIICTVRSKTEYAIDGKTVLKLGLSPVFREGFEYEFTTFFDISSGSSLTMASKDRTGLFSSVDGAGRVEKHQFVITPQTGELIKNWLNTGIANIEEVAEKLAAGINEADDVESFYMANINNIQRIETEKPEYMPLIQDLFEKRATALSGVIHSK